MKRACSFNTSGKTEVVQKLYLVYAEGLAFASLKFHGAFNKNVFLKMKVKRNPKW